MKNKNEDNFTLVVIAILIFIGLFAGQSWAQVRVEVATLDGRSFAGEFETEEEADQWVEDNERPVAENRGSWGMLERTLPSDSISQEEWNRSKETIPRSGKLGDSDYSPEMKVIPKDYTITKIDISGIKAAETAKQESIQLKKQQVLNLDASKTSMEDQVKILLELRKLELGK